jgi:hypothetical protein
VPVAALAPAPSRDTSDAGARRDASEAAEAAEKSPALAVATITLAPVVEKAAVRAAERAAGAAPLLAERASSLRLRARASVGA